MKAFSSGTIAYLTGEYPRATDTFIQREVAALRQHGLDIRTCSIRRTGPEHLIGPEQQAEAKRTYYVLEEAAKPLMVLKAHRTALLHPRRYFCGLKLAWRTAPKGLRGRVFNLIYFMEAVVLANWMLRCGITHLHNHIAKASCTVAMLASTISGRPYSFTLHGPDIFFEPYHWRLDEKIARASFVACISDFCRSQAMLFSAPENWSKLHVIHCGVDPARYGDPIPHTGQILLFVGRLAAVKGIFVLFEALKKLDDLHNIQLRVVGDGPERGALEAVAQRDRLPVVFTGYRSQAEVAGELERADAFVLPSFAEGLPVVLMEALAAGLPAIASQIAGIPELIQPGLTGVLVPPGNANELALAIRHVLSCTDTARSLGERGRQVVAEHFDSSIEAARLASLLAPSVGIGCPGKNPIAAGIPLWTT